ncbi:MAG: Translation initiation factor IF-3 [Chlamydiae bacterium]|nr:Translation initiation factor IF-3 [Chlamydiota bacterium]
MNFRINKRIRAPKVRVIGPDGEQIGVIATRDALQRAQDVNLDLVEVAANAEPPVCKIIDYGKFRYDQTKREKESKKAQHQVKVKEIKLKPNIDEHDFVTKQNRARGFLEKGNKVKVSCFFRGREMAHTEVGREVVKRMCEGLQDVAQPESSLKMMGRSMIVILAPVPQKPSSQKVKTKEKQNA